MKKLTKMLTFLLCGCFTYPLFADNLINRSNMVKTAQADTMEQTIEEKDRNAPVDNMEGYDYAPVFEETVEDDCGDCDNTAVDAALAECTEALSNAPVALTDNVVAVYSNNVDVKESIISDDTFSINATVCVDDQDISANAYYNFDNYSKYYIAQWAYEIGAISEQEKIECYCDLILNKNFDKVDCLNPFFDDIQAYSLNDGINEELSSKMESVLTPNVGNTVIGTRAITTEATYVNDYFTIHYDSSVDTYAEAQEVGNYFNQVRAQFLAMGFNSPICENDQTTLQIYLDPAPGGATAVTGYWPNSNTNVSASYIRYYGFTQLNNNMKQTFAHEYFHAIQNAYNYGGTLNQTMWFKEATANWAKFVITGSLSTAQSAIDSFIRPEEDELVSLSKTSGYGAVVFPLMIHRKLGGASTIKAIYETYHTYGTDLTMSTLRNIITAGISANGYSGGFDYAYRLMVSGLYNASVWYKTAGGYTSEWDKPNVTDYNISSPNGTVSFSVTLDYLTSKYFRIKFPTDTVSMMKVDVTFSNSDGRVQLYREQTQGHNIFFPNTSSNKATCAESSLGRFVRNSAIILSNLGNSGSVTCNVNVQLIPQDQSFNFAGSGTSRYAERQIYLTEGEYADYTITFATAGPKIIQTFGTLDTEIEIYNSSGTLLHTYDDEGYAENAFVNLTTTAGQTYKIRVKFHNTNQTGWTKLAITPANGDKAIGATAMEKYEDIWDITGPFTLVSYAQNNRTRILRFIPSTSGTYTVELKSEFDTYLYVIDPRSTATLVDGVDFNDEGNGTENSNDAKITRQFEAGVPYLIIYSQYNLSASFTDLGDGDDIRVKFYQ